MTLSVSTMPSPVYRVAFQAQRGYVARAGSHSKLVMDPSLYDSSREGNWVLTHVILCPCC